MSDAKSSRGRYAELGVVERTLELSHRNVRLHFVESEPRSSDSLTLVLLHGFPETWFAWHKVPAHSYSLLLRSLSDLSAADHQQIPELIRATYRVVAPDLRGFGRSQLIKASAQPNRACFLLG